MKKVMLFTIVVFSLFSCKKADKKRCWNCIVKQVGIMPDGTKVEICDKTQDEINDYIKVRQGLYHNDTTAFTMSCQ